MKITKTILILCFIFSAGIKAQDMNDLIVPEGFNYQSIQQLQLDLSFPELAAGVYTYHIKGLDKDGNSDLIMQNFLPSSRKLKTKIRIPLHIETIQVLLKSGDQILVFDYPKMPYITNEMQEIK